MYKKKKRTKRVAVDSKQIRLRTLVIFCFVLLVPALYLSYCVSGLYLLEVDVSHIKEQAVWCILHPVFCYNEKDGRGNGSRFSDMDDCQFLCV